MPELRNESVACGTIVPDQAACKGGYPDQAACKGGYPDRAACKDGYNDGVSRLSRSSIFQLGLQLAAFILLAITLAAQQIREGNFNIRAEPTAKLQTDAAIPFEIRVTDALRKPLVDAKVTLQIETADGRYVQVFRAPAIDKGVYMAKPLFRAPGSWSIYIEVTRDYEQTSRTYDYNIPRSTE